MRILGITCGIASIGWSVLAIRASSLTIEAAGVWAFDTPETPKERTPLNAVRRAYRGQRRVTRRRRLRMNEIRGLFHQAGLLPTADRHALQQRLNPWDLRAAALSRILTGPELAVALGHIAVRRGFKSNSKHRSNAPDDASRMKVAIAALQERQQRFRTAGEMFAQDPEFETRKRNRGDYTRSVLRADLEHEVRQIFAEQRQCGNPLASAELEASFSRIAFFQRPLRDSEHLVGACLFEPGEKRAARQSYAFELFRLLARLANLTLSDDGKHFRFTAAMIRRIAADFGANKRISFRSVRELLGLGPQVNFVGIAAKDEANDVVARQGNAAEGSYALRRVVGPEGWRWLMGRPAIRDRIAELLTYRDDPVSIRAGLLEAGLHDHSLLDAVMEGLEAGAFAKFSGAGHISAKAARALLPALQRGAGYYAACAAVGYDHAAPAKVSLDEVRNPVARKAVGEAVKQIEAIIKAYGPPDAIHIGLMREVGKSADERDSITRGIEDQNKKREASRLELEALLGRATKRGELLRYELWKEQDGRGLFTGEYIDPMLLVTDDRTVMVGHILPWSRFGDDSFANKTLCLVTAGQAKQDRTPYEWLGETEWAAFSARVEACKSMKRSKKAGFYLRQNAAEVEENFRNRHLSDSRYISRLLLAYIAQHRLEVPLIRARASQVTAKMRHAWGLDNLKRNEDGTRSEDSRHRAVDAIVLAATTDRTLEDLTQAAREAERRGSPRGFDFSLVPPPAEGFREYVQAVVSGIFPARAERRRVRGEIHAATIKRIDTRENATIVSERKPVEKLTLGDLDHIPLPTPYGTVANPGKLRDALIEGLRSWIERGRPKDDPPRSPKGDVIRKVRVQTRDAVRVLVRGGTADRGDMARVDVYRTWGNNGRARYHLVPIYPHQIADRQSYPRPPEAAVVAGASEASWTAMRPEDFLYSLFSHSLLEAAKPDGEVIRGYFKGVDRATGAIAIAVPETMRPVRIGARTLQALDKLQVDRLGVIRVVERETRTWRGVPR